MVSEDGQICKSLDTCVCKNIDGVDYTDGEKIESMSDTCQSWYVLYNYIL